MILKQYHEGRESNLKGTRTRNGNKRMNKSESTKKQKVKKEFTRCTRVHMGQKPDTLVP